MYASNLKLKLVWLSIPAADAGHSYSCKFSTPNSYGHVRLPYDTFLPLGGAPALDPGEQQLLLF